MSWMNSLWLSVFAPTVQQFLQMVCGAVAMARGAVASVYLKLLGNLGSVQEQSGAETVHRPEGSCRKIFVVRINSKVNSDKTSVVLEEILKLPFLLSCPGPSSSNPPPPHTHLQVKSLNSWKTLGYMAADITSSGVTSSLWAARSCSSRALKSRGGQRGTGATLDTGEALQHLEEWPKETSQEGNRKGFTLGWHAIKTCSRKGSPDIFTSLCVPGCTCGLLTSPDKWGLVWRHESQS